MNNTNIAIASLITGDAYKIPRLEVKNKKLYSKAIIPQHFERQVLIKKGVWWYDSLLALFNEGVSKRLINDLIIHGSYGDFSQTNFSDLEITVLLSDECFKTTSQSKLLKKWIKKSLNPLIVNVDPLQHHGCFFLWNDFLSSYDENYLPIAAYDKCWSIRGERLELKVINDIEFRSKSRKKLRSTLYSLENCANTYFRYGVNLYSMKRVLSNFFMLPVYMFQADGILLNKKSALDRAKAMHISDNFDKAMAVATQLRDEWPKQQQWKRNVRRILVKTKIPQGRMDLIACNLFRDLDVASRFLNEFLPAMHAALKDLRAQAL